MYVRKSSESEERQELSIPAQKRELAALAERRELTVLGDPWEESRSAKEPGRPVFNELLERVCQGDADGILCWKLDRLARNPVDGGRIVHVLGKGLIKSIVTAESTYTGTAEEKFMMSVMFGQATKYCDDLSVSVRRGNREALHAGRWPGKPKIGYRRHRKSMRLIPDRERFPILQEIGRRLLAGARPLDLLRSANEELHLRTPITGKVGGKPLSKAAIYRFLRDPFYTGVMVMRGVAYTGTHKPLFTVDEFERIQAILDGRVHPRAKPKRLFFVYSGLIRCGSCGAAVTAKNCTNRHGTAYTYYYCCRKERRYQYCPEGAVQERELDAALTVFLKQLVPPERWITALLKHLGQLEESHRGLDDQARQTMTDRLTAIDRQLERLRDLLVRSVLSEEDYAADQHRLVLEKRKLAERLQKSTEPPGLVEPHRAAIAELTEAAKLFERATPEEKRDLVQALTWNLSLKDKKVHIEAKKPFAYLGEWSRCIELSAWLDYVGTQLAVQNVA